uniref:Uncharacterized protein n=1 Tax=Opuntia streptacantha TaxID=393608 RepID=A0A7C8ZWH8_OPUST
MSLSNATKQIGLKMKINMGTTKAWVQPLSKIRYMKDLTLTLKQRCVLLMLDKQKVKMLLMKNCQAHLEDLLEMFLCLSRHYPKLRSILVYHHCLPMNLHLTGRARDHWCLVRDF